MYRMFYYMFQIMYREAMMLSDCQDVFVWVSVCSRLNLFDEHKHLYTWKILI